MSTSKEISTLIATAHQAGLAAENNPAPESFPISTVYNTKHDGLTTGYCVVGARIETAGEFGRAAALAAFSTDWSALIDEVRIVEISPQDRAILIGLRNTSDSVQFITARLRRAAECIGAALRTVDGVSDVRNYLAMDIAMHKMRQAFPGRYALHQQIVQMLYGGKAAEADSIELEAIHAQLREPEHMSAEDFARIQTIAEKVERRLSDPKSAPDTPELYAAITEIIDRSPWMMHPGESVVRKDRYADRPNA